MLKKELEKELNRTKLILDYAREEIKGKDKEIERLNNIIDEFEEELEREINIKEEDAGVEHNTYIDVRNTLREVLKRFRELKGSESNE